MAGRGRGMTLPAWMNGDPNAAAAAGGLAPSEAPRPGPDSQMPGQYDDARGGGG
ncbi:unnamed protein product, partial [Chrysoparadoxa australica]